MKNNKIKALVIAMAVCMFTAGCSAGLDNTQTADGNNAAAAQGTETAVKVTQDNAQESEQEESAVSEESSGIRAQSDESSEISSDSEASEKAESSEDSEDSTFTKRDLEQEADTEDAQYITVSDGAVIDITEAGTYVLSGSAKNCTVRVETDKESKVQLVLDGLEIVNDDFPAIYVVSADKVFITTAGGSTNTLEVTGSFTADGDTNTDAVIFSKDDLVLNGLGTLEIVSSYGNGISCKDDLKATGGSYVITSALDSIEANDSISISDGSFVINSSKDGLHCENDDDDTLGIITITGGSFEINAAADGIQGTYLTEIDGGSYNITAGEGIECTYVLINDGEIYITASDDGINASNKSKSQEVAIEINGSYLNIVMGQGDTDAIDANGNIYVNGGTIDITSTVSSFDYDGTAEYNGGTIIINGSQVDSIPQSMMGGPGGGFGGDMGGFGGRMGGRGGWQ
ncbi:MAG: carbohydrate-binding domain-containing protein [Ruminococcus sp.]|nr:carbohydrate-binding domain-containing protein [Ruminococcus sp.]